MLALFDFAAQHGALARTAGAVLAAIRQANTLAQCGDQDRFIGFYLKLPATLPEGYIKCHSVFEFEESVIGASRP